jgi:hypothetical protein
MTNGDNGIDRLGGEGRSGRLPDGQENLCHLITRRLPVFPQLPDRCHDQMLHESAAE